MGYRKVTVMGLATLCLVVIGCASPYVYYCDDSCGGPQAISGRYARDCGATPCAPCEGTTAGPFCGHTVTGLLRSTVTCNAGCGDMYWGEWDYDPPDACDPCNNHGDWTGPGCCPPGGWTRFWQGLHGARFFGGRSCDVACEPTCEPGCGCDDCGLPGDTIEGVQPYESWQQESGLPGEPQQLEPVPAPQPQLEDVSRTAPRAYYSRNPNSRLIRRSTR